MSRVVHKYSWRERERVREREGEGEREKERENYTNFKIAILLSMVCYIIY